MVHEVSLTDTFEGPLGLLLELVRRDEVDLHDIPIARLTRAYLEEIEKRGLADIDEAGEFIALAATLLEIKARALAPDLAPEGEDGDEDGVDPREGLAQALRDYLRYRGAAERLGVLAAEHALRYPRVGAALLPAGEEEAIGYEGAVDLMAAFENLLLRLETEMGTARADEIVGGEYQVETQMKRVTGVLGETPSTRFSLLLSDRPTRGEIVSFFLAVLELVRLGKIRARQASDFSDILIERRESTEIPVSVETVESRFTPVPAPEPFWPVVPASPASGDEVVDEPPAYRPFPAAAAFGGDAVESDACALPATCAFLALNR